MATVGDAGTRDEDVSHLCLPRPLFLPAAPRHCVRRHDEQRLQTYLIIAVMVVIVTGAASCAFLSACSDDRPSILLSSLSVISVLFLNSS